MKIHIKESTIVRPAQDTPRKSLWNSNLDLLVPRIHVPMMYFYKPNGSSNFMEARVLKEALSKVLVSFYPVAGRLGRDKNGGIEINCNEEGVLFIEADAVSAMEDLGDFTPSLELLQLTPIVDYSGDISSYPLLLVQVTYFRCGGVSVGACWHHTLADGVSGYHFVKTWSEVARGLPIIIPPFIDRTLLRGRVPPTPAFDHIEYQLPSSTNSPLQNPEFQSGPKATSCAKLYITLDQLNTLKAKLKKNENTVRYTTYETLAAHVWRCACKARGLSDDQTTKLYIAIDGRSRLRPPLPTGYFGNVLFTATPTAKSGDLKSQPFNYATEKIHNELTRMDDVYMRSALDYLELQPDLTPLVRGPHKFQCPNLNVVSYSGMPIHDADFGWGRPIYMGPNFASLDGMAFILPSSTKDGSYSLIICLETHHLQLFQKIFYDLDPY